MTRYAYTIAPQDPELGGGYRLLRLVDDEEVGSDVFPATPGHPGEDYAAQADAMTEGDAWLASRGGGDA